MFIKPNERLSACVVCLQDGGESTRTEAVKPRIEGKSRFTLPIGFIEKSGTAHDITHEMMADRCVGTPAQELCGLVVGAIQIALLGANGGGNSGPVGFELRLPSICRKRLFNRGFAAVSIVIINVIARAQLSPGRGITAVKRDGFLQSLDRELIGLRIKRNCQTVQKEFDCPFIS